MNLDSVRNASTTANTTINTNNMTIKSIELVQNISLAHKALTEKYVQTCLEKSSGKTITKTRGLGAIYENQRDLTLFTSFSPLPEVARTGNGKNNRVVVIFHYTDGSSKVLNSVETIKFWSELLGVENALDIDFRINANLESSVYDKSMVIEGLSTSRFQSIRVVLNDLDNMFNYSISEYNGNKSLSLRPQNAEVGLHSQLVESEEQYIGFKLNDDFYVDSVSVKPNFNACTKSTKRREGRRAQSKAARKSVNDNNNSTVVETVTAPTVVAPTVTTPDLAAIIQQAVQAAIAPLTQEIATLREELKAKDAEIEALRNNQTSPEVEETIEETVEEEINEEPTTSLKSKDAFFAGLNKAKKVAPKSELDEIMEEAEAQGFFLMDDDE